MEIFFRTKSLQKICSQQKETVKKLGPKCATKLFQRMMELQAAECLVDISRVPPPRCHELKGNRKGQFSVDLQHPYRLLFVPADDPPAVLDDGGADWKNVQSIEIVEIADTH